MLIYKITNKINGKCYIGQTVCDILKRWKEHLSTGTGCRALKRALIKYGPDNFDVDEIYNSFSMEDLNEKEEYFIKYYGSIVPNGYNIKFGGNNMRHHPETKRKIGEANKISLKGKRLPQEVKDKISKASKGKNTWSKGCKGRPTPEWLKEQLSKDRKGEGNPMYGKQGWSKGLKMSREWKEAVAKGRGVKSFYVIDSESGVVIKEYISRVLCAEDLGITKDFLHRKLFKKSKSPCKYKFIFVEDYKG